MISSGRKGRHSTFNRFRDYATLDAFKHLPDQKRVWLDVTTAFMKVALRNWAPFHSLRLKNAAFKEEREWRLIMLLDGRRPLRWRDSARGPVPYYPMPLAAQDQRLELANVMVGPSDNADRMKVSASIVLADAGYVNELGELSVPVERSRIPLRA